MKTYITGLEETAIYNYYIKRDRIELVVPGGVIYILIPEEIETIKRWIAFAKKWLPDDTARKFRVCNYLEYMFRDGQYEEEV